MLSAYLYTVGLVVLQVIVHLFQLHLGLFIPEGHSKVLSTTELSDYLLHNLERRRFSGGAGPPRPAGGGGGFVGVCVFI